LSTSQLALLDGRSLYLDFFGFVAWDLVPSTPTEVKQIEVIRGPASAIWGANALNGVINFISKTPRELNGDSVTLGFGGFDRDESGGGSEGTGSIFSVTGTHARAVNDRWSYKITAGAFSSDAFARPTGTIPNGTGTQYPTFQNQGTTQPKFSSRVDYDAPENRYRLTLEGGYSGTDGIIHTGIGPFDMETVGLGYGTMRYSRGGMKFNFFTNILDGDASALLAVDVTGQPILFTFDTQTYDFEFGNVNPIGTRQVISYGGNYRYNAFDLSIAPLGDNRSEGGAYVQDEIFINNHLRWNIGARLDKFDNIDDVMFSPRTAFIVKPSEDQAIRLSYNKAFRSPSLINNYLDVTIVNQLNLGLLNPALGGRFFNFPTQAVGNQALVEESTQSVELAYSGTIRNRATLSLAVYYTKNTDEMFFAQDGRYRAANPPPGWVATLGALGIPPVQALGALELIPPPCASLAAPCDTGGLPSSFTYLNLGEVRNKGFEIGIDGALNRAWNAFANYSYQATPDPDFDISEVNLPPKNRFNLGFNFSQGRYTGNANVNYVDSAYWQDVLDARYHGPTEAYTQVNGAFGVRFARDRVMATIKAINLFNREIQNHIFGDILRRQILGELKFDFKR
jgi:iron complex outermembrane receptor protein